MPDSITLKPSKQARGLRKYGKVNSDRFDQEVGQDVNGYRVTKQVREQATDRLPEPILKKFAAAGIDVVGFELELDAKAGNSGTPLVANVTGAIGVQIVWLTNDGGETPSGPHMYVFAKQGKQGVEPIGKTPDFSDRVLGRLFVAQYQGKGTVTRGKWTDALGNLDGRLLSGAAGLSESGQQGVLFGGDTWMALVVELSFPGTGDPCISNSSYTYGRWLVEYLKERGSPDPRSFSVRGAKQVNLVRFAESRLGSGSSGGATRFTTFVGTDGSDFEVGSDSVSFFGGNNAALRFRSSEWIAGWLNEWRRKLRWTDSGTAESGLDVLRPIAFGSDPSMCLPLQPEKGKHYEPALRQLDDLIYQCERHGVRLILPLANFWDWQGGVEQYLRWGDTTMPSPSEWSGLDAAEKAEKRYQFYDDSTAQQLYRDHIKRILTRTNGITGTTYKDTKSIMMWELMNEPRPPGEPIPSQTERRKFVNWVKDTAAYIKNIDSEHLVSTGMGGGALDRGSGPQEYVPKYYQMAHDLQNIDAWSLHVWVDEKDGHHDYSSATSTKGKIDLGKDVIRDHARAAESLGIPFYVGEFGWYADRETRTNAFKQWKDVLGEEADAALVWDMPSSEADPSRWDYGVFPAHTDTVGALRAIAEEV